MFRGLECRVWRFVHTCLGCVVGVAGALLQFTISACFYLVETHKFYEGLAQLIEMLGVPDLHIRDAGF